MDEMLSLAYSMYSNKGIYALLIGSGISRSAGIPTGWEIVLDLIKKLAKLNNEECGEKPDDWYRSKYKKEPDYSELLNEIAKTPTERQMILKKYFEPTSEELEEGVKSPTIAHKAIAKLVKDGFIKVIITTNFDRLMERALIELGITPTVISNLDTLNGAIPMIHSECTIIKVHGDYMDTRIKNTLMELESYDTEMNLVLDRVLDEFGLIICGWSAEWDIALRTCFERCKSHRFSTYWTSISEPAEKAKDLINIRKAQVVIIKGADEFFKDLNDKVMALEDIYKTHPLETRVAVSMLKKHIVKVENKIILHDLVIEETTEVCNRLNDNKFGVSERMDIEKYKKRIKEYEAIIEKLLHIIANGCYWGSGEFKDIWEKSIELVANTYKQVGGTTGWLDLKKYPALLMLYVGGISSIASGKFYNLYSITNKATIKKNNVLSTIIMEINDYEVFGGRQTACNALELPDRYTPVSEYLFKKLRDIFKYIIPLDERYEIYFDYFEYFLGLIYIDARFDDVSNLENQCLYVSIGRFSWKYGEDIENFILKDSEFNKNILTALKEGYFNGDYERYKKIQEGFQKYILKNRKC